MISKKNASLFFVFYIIQALALYALFFVEVNWLYLFLGWITFCGLGSAVVLHRHVSHRSIEFRKGLRKPLLLIGTLCGQGTPLWWAGVHRGMHHCHADQDGDAHAPKDGLFHAYIGWIHSKDIDHINPRNVTDLLRDKFHLALNKYYVLIFWSFLIVGLLVNPVFTLWFWIVPAAWSFHQEAIVNLLCHCGKFGYRNYESNDDAHNLKWLSFLTWGQSLHNNHHASAGNYSFANKGEFDPTVLFIPLIAKSTRHNPDKK